MGLSDDSVSVRMPLDMDSNGYLQHLHGGCDAGGWALAIDDEHGRTGYGSLCDYTLATTHPDLDRQLHTDAAVCAPHTTLRPSAIFDVAPLSPS